MPVPVEFVWIAEKSGWSRAVSEASSLGGSVAVCGRLPGSVVVVVGSVVVVIEDVDVVVVVVGLLAKTELIDRNARAMTVTAAVAARTCRRR